MVSSVLSAQPPTVVTFNNLFNLYFYIGLTASVVVIGMMVFFSVRYRARPTDKGPLHHRPESWKIVLVTVLISLTLLTVVEYQTFQSESNIQIPTTGDPVHINVLAYQWGWNFTYPNGSFHVGNLTVPVNEVVILNITSKDVFHSMGIPMFDVKEDAIPGKYNQMWFEATQTGFYQDAVRCYELCGVGHAYMLANLTVVSQAAWNSWPGSQ
ncbi:MAG TPA: cytochrome c oxidase subunit II [Nitrososphaerales archaeon]|nr:cytochrome c oxidase subunit II [Nitrososphaerales archaeon]